MHPRVCGGTNHHRPQTVIQTGASPRVRGNQRRDRTLGKPTRCIPACAGEPNSSHCYSPLSRVHPRVCGGTWGRLMRALIYTGASPRVRGNLAADVRRCVSVGCIPACAGEPSRPNSSCSLSAVHPRVCGGTWRGRVRPQETQGASPRVRGNHLHGRIGVGAHGCIPACAGEPHYPARWEEPPWVHPRVCGGTGPRASDPPRPSGASPRVRGNRCTLSARNPTLGCIPACAGEPWASAWTRSPSSVHPRVCGGTVPAPSRFDQRVGASPRVRGNHEEDPAGSRLTRCIPACAGEPTSRPTS